jgi:hypothetical protein
VPHQVFVLVRHTPFADSKIRKIHPNSTDPLPLKQAAGILADAP